jgi:hypothetical protein
MTTCTIVGVIVTCLIDAAARQTPTDAARVLLPHQYAHVELAPLWGPTSVAVQSNASDGPFGPLRLSSVAPPFYGSLLWQPPWRIVAYQSFQQRPRHEAAMHHAARALKRVSPKETRR